MSAIGSRKISVLIPTFNQSAYLGEALECALSQSTAPFEVVVVDDGSTDDTTGAVSPFLSRVRYHRQENQGIGGARNQCLKMARGDLLAFLDSDDIWPERSLEVRVGALDRDPGLAGVAGIVEQFMSPDVPAATRDQYHVSAEKMVARFAGSMLLKRRAFDVVGFFDPGLRVGDTLDWLARAEAEGLRIGSVEEVVLRRRIHGNNTTVRERDRKADYLRVLKAALDRRRSRGQEGEGS